MKKITFLVGLIALFSTNLMAQDDFAQGTSYHLIYLDDASFGKLPAGSIAKDMRVDDANYFLYIWSGTYTSLNPIGPNWNGEDGYLSFEVGNGGWSGLGFFGKGSNDLSVLEKGNYVLHMALKSSDDASHIFGMNGPGNIDARINIGSKNFVDGNNTYTPLKDFTRDGNWHVVEIPMKAFFDKGLKYPEPLVDKNILYFLSGGTPGVKINADAIFIYKNVNNTGLENISSRNLNLFVSHQTISIPGADKGFSLYSVSGLKLKETQEAVMGIEGLNAGAYIVRCGNLTQKVLIK